MNCASGFRVSAPHFFGRIGSIVLVQGMSIPFLVVLGFSPIFWTVVLAMAVRNSLMNAGSPMATAFAQEQVRRDERATLAAISDRSPASGSSCLGRAAVESGQNRDPTPPASTTAQRT